MTTPEMCSIPLGWSIDNEGRRSREQELVRHFAPDEAAGDVRDKRGDGSVTTAAFYCATSQNVM